MYAQRTRICILMGMLLSVLSLAASASAQGRILIEERRVRPMPPPQPGQTSLVLKSLRVHADVTDGVAVTTVEQSFQNPLRRQVEGVYIFPLPDGVAVGDFSMTLGGKTLHGEVLDADAARKTYEDIVRRLRDPGLLEYLGSRLFRARIFPIPASGKVDVKLQYSQTLVEQAGLGLFQLPLRHDPAGGSTVDQIAVSIKLKSTLPLTTVFSPSHDCEITQFDDHEASVSYEATHAQPDRDFKLYYQRKDAAFGMALLTHRGPGEPGTFLLRVSPRVEWPDDKVLPKDIAFVIDTSGSMAGVKMQQAKSALKFCINSLGPDDRFNIYGFSTEVHAFRDGLVPADADVTLAALRHVEDLKALGGTNINAALLAALEDDPRDDKRVYMIVFVTDGQPTVDVTDPEQIRKNVVDRNTRRIRLHVLGVGSDVNTHLLDKLAEATRGARDYCTENEDLELKLSALVTRLAHPVLTDLALHIDGIQASDVYPQKLPDLFRGSDLVVLGRYGGSGTASVRLEGRTLDTTKVLGYEGSFPRIDTGNDFLPRLWANRKVAYLLDQVRLHGPNQELIDEITRLAKRYGIVTPYTAALIIEEGSVTIRRPLGGVHHPMSPPRLDGGRPAGGGAGTGGQGGIRFGPASGASALRESRRLERAKLADSAEAADSEFGVDMPVGQRLMRHVGDKAFVNQDGRWTDTTWDGKQTPQQVIAFSEAHFRLLAQQPELKKYFAIGERVLVVLGDTAYESVPAGNDGQ